MTRFWDGRTDRWTDGQTDGVTALLDLLSPLAMQVEIKRGHILSMGNHCSIFRINTTTIKVFKIGQTRFFQSPAVLH